MIMDQRDQAPARAEAEGRGGTRGGGDKRKSGKAENCSVDGRTDSGGDVVGRGVGYWKWS